MPAGPSLRAGPASVAENGVVQPLHYGNQLGVGVLPGVCIVQAVNVTENNQRLSIYR